jgi:hypothetical protein
MDLLSLGLFHSPVGQSWRRLPLLVITYCTDRGSALRGAHRPSLSIFPLADPSISTLLPKTTLPPVRLLGYCYTGLRACVYFFSRLSLRGFLLLVLLASAHILHCMHVS